MDTNELRTCSACQNDLVCHDQGKCLRPTPETDAYKGTHETHRIGGKTLYDHAEQLERQRDEALDHIAELEKQLAGLQKPKEQDTFEAYGEIWIKHTPGNPMPCADDSTVRLTISGFTAIKTRYTYEASSGWVPGKDLYYMGRIIGWNYADAP